MSNKGNPGLKSPYKETQYTPEMVSEVMKCADDPVYFIMTYCKIQHPVKGDLPFNLYPYQQDMLHTFQRNRLSIVLSPRQSGKSWTCGAYLLWYVMFHPDKTALIASNKNSNAMEMINRAQYLYERLPEWIKPGLVSYTKHSIEFDNNSRLLSQATTENTGRGMSISLLFLDEFAFVPNNIQDDLWTSLSPTLATGGSLIICSTPNGDVDKFSELWRGANIPKTDDSEIGINGFAPVAVKWTDPPGRDERFKQDEIAKIGETKWLQEYECQFISSDPLLIDTVVLATITNEVERNKPIGTVSDIKLYEQPRAGATYLVGIDPATGSGEDFTVVQAYRFPDMVQVAEFRSNTMSPSQAYYVIKKLIRMFEKIGAMVYYSVENNGVGEAIITLIETDDDPLDSAEFVSEEGQKRKGMTTTSKSKIRACIAFKEMVEKRNIKINSPSLVKELKHFVRAKGSYAAQKGATDDLIMATIIAIRLLEEIASFDQDAYDKLYTSAFVADDENVDEEYDPSMYISFG